MRWSANQGSSTAAPGRSGSDSSLRDLMRDGQSYRAFYYDLKRRGIKMNHRDFARHDVTRLVRAARAVWPCSPREPVLRKESICEWRGALVRGRSRQLTCRGRR
jgi:hypothetical protein